MTASMSLLTSYGFLQMRVDDGEDGVFVVRVELSTRGNGHEGTSRNVTPQMRELALLPAELLDGCIHWISRDRHAITRQRIINLPCQIAALADQRFFASQQVLAFLGQ